MAFGDFKTIEQVLQKYPLAIEQRQFVPDVSLELPGWFLENIKFSLERQGVQESEIFWRESYIYPFLQQAWKRHNKLKVWSNRALTYNEELYGEPDYLIAKWSTGEVISKLVNRPLLAVAEAKRQDFDQGWAQCLAEMIACQKVNDDEDIVIYGIVSTGLIWQFGKLAKTTLTQDPLAYSISDPARVLGILDFIFAECEKQL